MGPRKRILSIVRSFIGFRARSELNDGNETVTNVDVSPIDDPLDYWVQNESKYEPILPVTAQDILVIPATNTLSERLFSASVLLSSLLCYVYQFVDKSAN